jgi:hypothetical protein
MQPGGKLGIDQRLVDNVLPCRRFLGMTVDGFYGYARVVDPPQA